MLWQKRVVSPRAHVEASQKDEVHRTGRVAREPSGRPLLRLDRLAVFVMDGRSIEIVDRRDSLVVEEKPFALAAERGRKASAIEESGREKRKRTHVSS